MVATRRRGYSKENLTEITRNEADVNNIGDTASTYQESRLSDAERLDIISPSTTQKTDLSREEINKMENLHFEIKNKTLTEQAAMPENFNLHRSIDIIDSELNGMNEINSDEVTNIIILMSEVENADEQKILEQIDVDNVKSISVEDEIMVENTGSNLRCETCLKLFKSTACLKRHQQYHAKNSIKFETEETLMERDLNQRNVIRCEFCSKLFKSPSLLKNHERCHTGEKPYMCSNCGKTFSIKSNLHQHHLTHQAERPFACTDCSSTFKTERRLKLHNDITHSDFKPYSCSICGTKFKIMRNMRVHMNIHSGIKPFQCDQCDYSSVRKSCLVTHQWTHKLEKRFSCGDCGQFFTTKAKLTDHMNNHNNIKPFMCKYCKKGFTRKDNLKVHVRSHIGTKPYKCMECDKLFSSLQGLNTHKKKQSHNAEKAHADKNTWDEVPMKANMVSVQIMTHYDRKGK